MKYPVPTNEAERLRTLRSYKILDTKPEERFDKLTQLAALICDAPKFLLLNSASRTPLLLVRGAFGNARRFP